MEECYGGTLEQKDIDEAMNLEGVELKYNEAVVTSASDNKQCENLIEPRDIRRNEKETVQPLHYTTHAKWTNSTEKWKETTSGWSVSGKLGLGYEGAEASTTATYHRGKTEKEITRDMFEVSKDYEKDIEMLPRSVYELTVLKEETTYIADIEGLLLTFPKDKSMKRWFMSSKQLSRIFNTKKGKEKIVSNVGGKITVQINGKFEAKNVNAEVKEYLLRRI